jgi:hypothetical protein
VRFLCSVCLCAICLGCGSSSRGSTSPAAGSSAPAPGGDWFVDRAAETGLNFTHVNGMSGKFDYAEIIGSGVALFDYDNDGDLDIYFAQGQPLRKSSADNTQARGGRLFRNDLVVNPDGTRTLTFTDVTEKSGIVSHGYGMGVATGDFNNDGCVDLYLTNLGQNQLFRNNCDGTFTDVSKQSGMAGTSGNWSVSAAFVDYDRDGWLDLFVGNYLNWNVATSMPCFSQSGRPDYCSPNVFQPQASRLYHNNRDGTFTDVTKTAGISGEFGPALGVSTADFNGDGWPDIYVANDGQPNQLWINQHDGTFRNTALLAGAALAASGKAKGSMGVDAADIDNDGDEDLFMTELTGEGANFYVNDGSGVFEERGVPSGLAALTVAQTGFGTAWIDFDNDGRLDLLTVNGAVQTIESLARVHDPFPLHQQKRLFRNPGNGRFEDVTAQAGAVFALSEVGRGAAFGDIDNDGDIDVVVNNNNGPARLLINNVGNKKHWMGLRLIGGPKRPALPKAPADVARPFQGRDMLGARVQITLDNGTTLWRRARADGSYASANDPRVLVGLGESSAAPHVRVIWPDGKSETWSAVQVDRYTTLQEGTGR